MNDAPWKPRVTVAAVAERDGRYLLVRERVDGEIVYNQPAGHLDPGETLVDAVIRETLEETGYRFTPTALQAVYRYLPDPDGRLTFLRFLFRGEAGERIGDRLDDDILSADWYDYAEIRAFEHHHRSPLVMRAVDDHRRHPGYPLAIVDHDFA